MVITYWCLQNAFPAPDNATALKVSLTPSYAIKWADSILYLMRGRTQSHSGPEELIAGLNVAQIEDSQSLRPMYA